LTSLSTGGEVGKAFEDDFFFGVLLPEDFPDTDFLSPAALFFSKIL
jgi:hypothetical protein